jgi:hypothetical protein
LGAVGQGKDVAATNEGIDERGGKQYPTGRWKEGVYVFYLDPENKQWVDEKI